MRYCAQRTAVMLALATTAAGATLHKVPLYGMDSSLSSPPPNRLGWLVAEQWSAQPRAISSPHSHGITLTGSSRVFLGDNVMDSMEAAEWSQIAYRKLDLLGKTLSFDIDLSKVGCGCNAAVYLVGMEAPGATSSQVSGAS